MKKYGILSLNCLCYFSLSWNVNNSLSGLPLQHKSIIPLLKSPLSQKYQSGSYLEEHKLLKNEEEII